MAIEKFVRGEEFKKLIDDKLINRFGVTQVLRKKGILPIFVSLDSLSDLTYRIIFGSDTMTQVHNIMNVEQNNIKSTMVVLSPPANESESEFLTALCDEFVQLQRIPNTKYKLRQVQHNDSKISFQYEYEKPQKGRLSLASSKQVILDICITAFDKKQYKVSIRHDGAAEAKQFVSLLESMVNNDPVHQVFRIKRITLNGLLKIHKVDFFDRFGSYKHKEWTLVDINNVTVNVNGTTIDADEDADDENTPTVQEYMENEPTGRLTGISSAILTGAGLRNNDFVKECMTQGFIFSSMRFKFNHKFLPNKLEIDVNFKQTDLKINIVKTYEIDDEGKECVLQLPHSDQTAYIDYFQNVAYEIYSELIKKQGATLVKSS